MHNPLNKRRGSSTTEQLKRSITMAFISTSPVLLKTTSPSAAITAQSFSQTGIKVQQTRRCVHSAHRYNSFSSNSFLTVNRDNNLTTNAKNNASQTINMSASEPPRNQPQPTAKELAKLYGGSYLGTSIAMSLVSFGVLYGLVYVGVDVRSLTNAFGDWLGTTPLGRPAVLDNVSDAASAAAIAYVAHKVTSPLRFPLTIAATPFVARIFSPQKAGSATETDSE